MNAIIPPCHYFHFGLIVTGRGEREHLPRLFRSLMDSKICHFQVIQFTGQRNPISSQKQRLDMVGQGKRIPDKDAMQIGFPARKYLHEHPCHSVVLIDDLEYERRNQAQQVFKRYRIALDTILDNEQQRRASVHFLVNMLEAYFFADAKAVNAVLHCDPPLEDYEGNVETIRHPKGRLTQSCEGYSEIVSLGEILDRLDVEHVLSRPDTCTSLRTLFAWCVKKLEQYPQNDYFQSLSLTRKYRLDDGEMWEITKDQ